MSRKRWKICFTSRAAAAATLNAQSTAGRVRAMPTRARRNQPIFQSHHCLPPNKRLNDGTVKEALNPDEDRDRDFAQSFRSPCRQRQDQPAGSGPVRRPLQGLRLRNGQAWRSGMAGKRAADLRIRFPAHDPASLHPRRKSVAPVAPWADWPGTSGLTRIWKRQSRASGAAGAGRVSFWEVPRGASKFRSPGASDYRVTCRNGVPARPHRQGWCSDTRPGDRLRRARG